MVWSKELATKELQEGYDVFVKIVNRVLATFGKRKKEASTDDKLSIKTKLLISKREEIGAIRNKTARQKIEWGNDKN